MNSLKRSSGHVECNFDNSPEFFLSKIRHVFAQSPKRTKQNFNLAKLLIHKIFLMRRKLQVLETCRKSSPKFRRFFDQSVNTIKIYNFFPEKSSLKRSSGQVESNFDNSAEVFVPKVGLYFGQTRELIKKIYSFQKFHSTKRSSWDVNCRFEKLAEILRQNSESFSIKVLTP